MVWVRSFFLDEKEWQRPTAKKSRKSDPSTRKSTHARQIFMPTRYQEKNKLLSLFFICATFLKKNLPSCSHFFFEGIEG